MNRNYFSSFVHLLIFSLTGLAFIHHTSAQIVTYSYEARVTQDSVFLGQQVAEGDMLFGRFQFDHCQLAPDGSDISASYSIDIEDGFTMVFNGESFSADEYLIAVDNTPFEDELIVFGCLNAGNFVFLQFTDSTGDALPDSGLPTNINLINFDSAVIFEQFFEEPFIFIDIETLNRIGFILGDINSDGSVNLLDVAPFVDALAAGDFIETGDFNCDDRLDLLDIQGFVDALTNQPD